ncbi:MAG: DEAD/DEAH box helicase [Pseudomonadota bacterium]
MSFKHLGLSDHLCDVLDHLGYEKATDIQAQALPEVLKGNDVLGIAQTGTGKTGAFCLPILERLINDGTRAESKKPAALIVAPTRELVSQILEETKRYVGSCRTRCSAVTGGVSQRPQERRLNKGVEVLVATPGRLLDLATNGHLDLSAVSYFVLDEADQLLDMGFIRDIRRIIKLLPKKRQSLLFSATMPKEVESLAHHILHRPVQLKVTPQTITVEKIKQGYVSVNASDKQEALQCLLSKPEVRKSIVFTRTKHGANRVAQRLNKHGVCVEVIHGNKSQNARNRALESFKSGHAWVLVATDVAARGIDIQDVTHVINFDLPQEPESYVHRVGRTARAGAEGVAWSLVDRNEVSRLRKIEKLTKVKIRDVQLDLDGGDRGNTSDRIEKTQASKPRNRRRRRRGRAPKKAA